MPTRRLLTSLGNTSQNQIQITAIRLLAVSRFFLRGVTLKAGVALEATITLEAGITLETSITLETGVTLGGRQALGDSLLANRLEVVV